MKIHLKKQLVFVIPIIIAFTLTQAQDKNVKKEPGIIISNMDLSVKPNDDFYKFVNGGWLKNFLINFLNP